MSALEYKWVKDAHEDRTQDGGEAGFTQGDWRRAREKHALKMKANQDG